MMSIPAWQPLRFTARDTESALVENNPPPQNPRCDCRRCCLRCLSPCQVKTKYDGLVMIAIIGITLGMSSVLLTTAKLVICGPEYDIWWCYGFFVLIMLSCCSAVHFAVGSSESKWRAHSVALVSFVCAIETVVTLVHMTHQLNGYLKPTSSTQKDYFCHHGNDLNSYIHIHYITMYFIMVGSGLTILAQGILGLVIAGHRRCWCRCKIENRGHTNTEEETSGESEDENETSLGDSETETSGDEIEACEDTSGDGHVQVCSGTQEEIPDTSFWQTTFLDQDDDDIPLLDDDNVHVEVGSTEDEVMLDLEK